MRIAHATDIHWFHHAPLSRLANKRLLGAANLYLKGRAKQFDPLVQADLVRTLTDLRPDAVLITGDLTAQALEQEFETARKALDPVLTGLPTFVQAGNHDVYTRGAARERRLARWFAPWMASAEHGLARFHIDGLTVVGLDPNRPHLLASGWVPDEQLAALPAALEAVPADDALILALHYPVLDRRGGLYDGWEHGLRNAGDLVAVLREARRKPDLIVHGHAHHGYRVDLDLGDAKVPICDPGSGGYAYLPHQDRAACFNVYHFDAGALTAVERYRYGPQGFAPEEGGAYATGR